MILPSDGGDLYVWGWNESGQLGLPSRSLRKTLPQQSSPKAGKIYFAVTHVNTQQCLNGHTWCSLSMSLLSCVSIKVLLYIYLNTDQMCY